MKLVTMPWLLCGGGALLAGAAAAAWWIFHCARTPEVVFIPGWQTEHVEPEFYAKRLKWIYPGAKVRILRWSSSARWREAKRNAASFIPEVVGYIAAKSGRERSKLILVGHSLGSRIAVGAARQLAARKLKIRQFVLLGAALNSDADVSVLNKASIGTNLNLFSQKDTTLKLLYGYSEKKSAAGFCGFDSVPAERFQQYELFPDARSGGFGKLEFINHTAETYLGELKHVVNGECTPYHPRYDYSKVDLGLLPVPKSWLIPAEVLNPETTEVLDRHANWKLVKIKTTPPIYVIVNHHGKIVQYSIDITGMGLAIRHCFERIRDQITPLPPPEIPGAETK